MLYKKVDASSPDTITSGLDLFSTPPTNCAISNSSYREYLTVFLSYEYNYMYPYSLILWKVLL